MTGNQEKGMEGIFSEPLAPYGFFDWIKASNKTSAHEEHDESKNQTVWSSTSSGIVDSKASAKKPRGKFADENDRNRPRQFTGTSVRKLGWGLKNVDKKFKSHVVSVPIDPSWVLLEEIEFSQLTKLQAQPEDPVILKESGSKFEYDRSNDRLSLKNSYCLHLHGKEVTRHMTTSKDQIFSEIIRSSPDDKLSIYMTDLFCSWLMSCTRPHIPWDFIVKRDGSRLVFDKRDDSDIDLVFLNETASDEKDEMELRRQTAWDAALVNQNISSGLSSKRNPASQKYPKHQYAKLNFGESASLYVRSEIDSQCDNNNIIIKSILDNDPRGINPEWQQKIDNQRGAVLVKELTNNNALISRWVIQAIIANVDILKLAYVIRTPNVPRKDNSFSVIAVEDYVPTELANQIGINIYNGFGIIKAISEKISSLPVYSQYILMKDPNRPQMRIYGASF